MMLQNAIGRVRGLLHRRQALAAFLLIAAVFALAHGPRVKANYRKSHFEDLTFIQHARVIESFGGCFNQGSVHPGLYRPLTTNLYYFIGRKLFSNRIEILHIINVGTYLANGFLLYFICLALLPRLWAVVPPIIFVSRFSHAEVVNNTCEFQSLLSVFFALLALKLFMTSRIRRKLLFGVLSMTAFALALFSKETAVVFPALLLAFGWLLDRQFSWRHYLAPILAAGLLIVLYALVLRKVVPHQQPMITFSISFSNVVRNLSAYVLVFLNVVTYKSQNMRMPAGVFGLASTHLVETAFMILLASCLLFSAIQHRLRGGYVASGRLFAFGFLFFAIATAPYAILDARLFMRYGYFGHAGLAISSGVVLHEVAVLIFRGRQSLARARRAASCLFA